jgi:type IV secretory pathway protease TraF
MQPGMSGDTHAHAARARRLRRSLMLGVLALTAVASTRWLRVTISPSVPLGLDRLAPMPTSLPRGTLVLLPVPPAIRPWPSAWLPLLTPVAAVAGATVCVDDEGLWVAGVSYGRGCREAQGHARPRMQGCHEIQDGAVLLARPAPRSLDGRSFGPTPVVALTVQALPLITWEA